MSAVELRGVRLERAGTVVLDEVDLTVAPGERVAVLGPSGSGKTTLLRAIAGLEKPRAGMAKVWGQPVDGPTSHVAMVFQRARVYDHLDVERNLAFPLDLTGAEGDVEETGRRFSIRRLFRQRPDRLSAGQRGLVAAARAVVRSDVRLVLLDEVLVATDPGRRRRIVDSMMGDPRVTVVFTSNDPGDVFRYADRVAVIEDGHIGQIDDPRAIYRRPASLTIADLMGEVNRFPGTIRSGDGTWVEVGESVIGLGERQRGLADGSRVVVAVRPRDLRVAGPSTPFGQVLHGTVGRVEPLGAGTRVLFGFGDAPGVAFSAVVDDTAVGVGWRCRWQVPTERVVLFDPADGRFLDG